MPKLAVTIILVYVPVLGSQSSVFMTMFGLKPVCVFFQNRLPLGLGSIGSTTVDHQLISQACKRDRLVLVQLGLTHSLQFCSCVLDFGKEHYVTFLYTEYCSDACFCTIFKKKDLPSQNYF